VDAVFYLIGTVVICRPAITERAVAMLSRCVAAGEIVYYCVVVYDSRLMHGGDLLSSVVGIPLADDD
jgi:hypothetical protein